MLTQLALWAIVLWLCVGLFLWLVEGCKRLLINHRLRQFAARNAADQQLILSLARLQTNTWLDRIMTNGSWQHYEIHRYFLPHSMTWSYTPAEGVVLEAKHKTIC